MEIIGEDDLSKINLGTDSIQIAPSSTSTHGNYKYHSFSRAHGQHHHHHCDVEQAEKRANHLVPLDYLKIFFEPIHIPVETVIVW